MELVEILGNLANASPAIVIWIMALTLSSILLKKNNGRLERLLVIGSSLLLAASVLSIFAQFPLRLLIGGNTSIQRIGMIMSFIGLFLSMVKLAGAICLIYATWKKFKMAGTEAMS